MRRWETNAEAMDAISSRVLNEAMDKGLNLNHIYQNTNRYLSEIGVNSEGLDDIEKIQLALAFNAPSGDETFEDIKLNARKGIAKVVNENNALAFMDYIQAFPFMNYTKSFLRDFGNRGWRFRANSPEDQWI